MTTPSLLKKTLDKVISLFPIDIGAPGDVIVLAGMGRTGTTWAGDIINYDNSYRVLFEPFFPAAVKQAKDFDYIQYLSPTCDDANLIKQAKRILAGEVRNSWVDRDNDRILYRRRIIKDIRCNLMLGWLKEIANPPIVLTVRHPLQVAWSWGKLGWGEEAYGSRSDFDIITSQESLLKDFPMIADMMRRINPEDFVEKVVFLWCVFYSIPIRHLKKDDAHTLFYENLLINPNDEVARLFHYLGRSFNIDELRKTMRRSSSTNFLGRDFSKDQSRLKNSWKDEFSTGQIRRANDILTAFGLSGVYDKNGYPTSSDILIGKGA